MLRRIRTSTSIAAALLAVLWLTAADATMQQGASNGNAATPRTPDGKVDFSGMWVGTGGGDLKPDESGNITVLSRGRPCHPGQECKPAINFERDSGVRQRMSPNLPKYKAEHWARVEDLDVNGNFRDPEIKCYPAGLPRIGAPSKIVQTPTEIIFLYASHNTFRVGASMIRFDRRTSPTTATRSASGKATRSSSTASGSPTKPGLRGPVISTPTTCAWWNA
jgi:hypothetical protein